MREAYIKFMNGRYGQYGIDGFGWFLLIIGLILSGAPYLWPISPLLGGWEMYRLLSKNTAVRYRENQDFRELAGKATGWLSPVLLPLKRAAGKVAMRITAWGLQRSMGGGQPMMGGSRPGMGGTRPGMGAVNPFGGRNKTIEEGKRFVSQSKLRFQERKTSLFVRCPQCKNLLRLPRGKGRLEATCPVCRNTFEQRT